MKIAISGASGLIGTALARSLRLDGHEVVPLVRRPVTEGEPAVAVGPRRRHHRRRRARGGRRRGPPRRGRDRRQALDR